MAGRGIRSQAWFRALFGAPKGPDGRAGEPALDLWSLAHVATGAALAIFSLTWYVVLGLLIAYEVFEGLLRRIKTKAGAGLFEFESWKNITVDIIVGMIGFWVADPIFDAFHVPPWP